ncbi:MAG TPA: hypothetical protein VFI75_08875, partial [Candidatus Acidoferrum sp.]|nr:hypothetical protein [Candidatus Acidoferrum sp.]
AGDAAGDFGDIVAKVFPMDFDPGIEGRILGSGGFGKRGGANLGHGMENGRQGKTSFEKRAARVFHGGDS